MKNLKIEKPVLKSEDIKNINNFCKFMNWIPKISFEKGQVKRAIIIDENDEFVGYIQSKPYLSYIGKDGILNFIFSEKELQRAMKIAEQIILPEENKPKQIINFKFIRRFLNGNDNKSQINKSSKEKIFCKF